MIVLFTLNLWFWERRRSDFRSSVTRLSLALRDVPFLPQTFRDQQRPNASLAALLYPAGSEDTCIQELSQAGILPFKDVRDLRSMPVHAFYINVAEHADRRQRIERRFEAEARKHAVDKASSEHNDDDLDSAQDASRQPHNGDLGVGSGGQRMGEYHLHRIDAATNCTGGKYHCVVQSHLRAIETATHYLAADRPNEFQDFALIMEDDITLELEAFWSVLMRLLRHTHGHNICTRLCTRTHMHTHARKHTTCARCPWVCSAV